MTETAVVPLPQSVPSSDRSLILAWASVGLLTGLLLHFAVNHVWETGLQVGEGPLVNHLLVVVCGQKILDETSPSPIFHWQVELLRYGLLPLFAAVGAALGFGVGILRQSFPSRVGPQAPPSLAWPGVALAVLDLLLVLAGLFVWSLAVVDERINPAGVLACVLVPPWLVGGVARLVWKQTRVAAEMHVVVGCLGCLLVLSGIAAEVWLLNHVNSPDMGLGAAIGALFLPFVFILPVFLATLLTFGMAWVFRRESVSA